MELRQLRYLVALADEQHFTRAAAREHVAQPALSQQIRRLEAEVGLPLVERTTRRVALTDAGVLLAARARRVLAEVDAARAELQELTGIRGGRVAVGAISTLGHIDLSLLLATFHARHPQVELDVQEGSSGELAAMLRVDAVDLAFLSVTGRIESQGLHLERLLDEELVAVLPAGHRLAGREAIALTELREERFVSFHEGARIRELLVDAARAHGFEPRLAFESGDVRRIRALVARGLGVAILPRSDAAGADEPLVLARLSEPPLSRDVTLAWRAERHHAPAARAFLELARAAAADQRRPDPAGVDAG
jgi:DNA-binding transcriptional LysR family regulator